MKKVFIPIITMLIAAVAGIALVLGKLKRKKDILPEIQE